MSQLLQAWWYLLRCAFLMQGNGSLDRDDEVVQPPICLFFINKSWNSFSVNSCSLYSEENNDVFFSYIYIFFNFHPCLPKYWPWNWSKFVGCLFWWRVCRSGNFILKVGWRPREVSSVSFLNVIMCTNSVVRTLGSVRILIFASNLILVNIMG